MTDRSLGKLSKYTVRPSPSSGEGVGCWLSHISYRFETTPVHERLLAGYFLPPPALSRRIKAEPWLWESKGPLNFYDLVLASRICWHPRRRILPAVSQYTNRSDGELFETRRRAFYSLGKSNSDQRSPGKSGQCLERRQLRRIRGGAPLPSCLYAAGLRWTPGFPRPVINSCRLRHGFST